MVSSRPVITESSGYRTLTESLASQNSRVERFSHQHIFSAERHGKRSERFAPVRSRSSDHEVLVFQVPAFEHFTSLPVS